MRYGFRRTVIIWLAAAVLAGTAGCGQNNAAQSGNRSTGTEGENPAPVRSMELFYAKNFSVNYYEGGYTELLISDGTRLFVVPEGEEAPAGLSEEPGEKLLVIRRPVDNIYLAASAVMDMFCRLDAVDRITLSAQKEEGWYLEEAREAMRNGSMEYAGKYNTPDYERIVSKGCSLAIENTMISHAPEAAEKLESFGIPVMIDYSSRESHPLGRVEWIRFYGALLGEEELADRLFEEQMRILKEVSLEENTGKTAAFFFITSGGLIQVRAASDYVSKMIGLAGGKYVFDDLGGEDSGRSTVNIQMEDFYKAARDADVLIYNSAIDGGVSSLEELVEKSGLLADFKAVKEGNVWCTTNDMYQQSMAIGDMIGDFHRIFAGGDESEMRYLFRLK